MAKRAKAATQSKTEATGGRPRIRITADEVEKLARLLCTYEEAASWFGITERTFIRRVKEPALADAWAIGKAGGKLSLRRLHWRHASMPNSAGVTMTIHMSKHQLGETEKAALELSGHIDSTVEVSSARDRVNAKLDTLAQRVARRVDSLATAVGAKRAAGEPVG